MRKELVGQLTLSKGMRRNILAAIPARRTSATIAGDVFELPRGACTLYCSITSFIHHAGISKRSLWGEHSIAVPRAAVLPQELDTVNLSFRKERELLSRHPLSFFLSDFFSPPSLPLPWDAVEGCDACSAREGGLLGLVVLVLGPIRGLREIFDWGTEPRQWSTCFWRFCAGIPGCMVDGAAVD
jgi:hypothetical protein